MHSRTFSSAPQIITFFYYVESYKFRLLIDHRQAIEINIYILEIYLFQHAAL